MPRSGDRMPITMVEEESVSDSGFIEFLRFLIPLDAMKNNDNFEAERGKENSDIRLLMN